MLRITDLPIKHCCGLKTSSRPYVCVGRRKHTAMEHRASGAMGQLDPTMLLYAQTKVRYQSTQLHFSADSTYEIMDRNLCAANSTSIIETKNNMSCKPAYTTLPCEHFNDRRMQSYTCSVLREWASCVAACYRCQRG